VILVETGIETDKLFTSVMPDHVKLGESLADAAIRGKAARVGILSGNQSQLGMQQRLDSVKGRLSDQTYRSVLCGVDSAHQCYGHSAEYEFFSAWSIREETCRRAYGRRMEIKDIDVSGRYFDHHTA
jgi:DNA-binding LacI/PurR family transcriptional regulator